MEALNFLKFWRLTTNTTQKENQPSSGNTDITEIPSSIVEMDDEFDEGEDSFIDLELALPDFDNKKNNNNNNKSSFDSIEDQLHNSAKNAGDIVPKSSSQQTLSLSSNDVLSKRRIMPIEPTLRPQSPISLLKSAPRFRVSIFKKSKSTATQKTEKAEKTELNGVPMETSKNEKQESKLYTVKFKIEEAAAKNISMFTRGNSLRTKQSLLDDSSSSDASKRFSKDLIQKYLKLIKPLYIKVSKRNSHTHSDKLMGFSGELSTASSVPSSPAMVSIFSPKKDKEKHPNIPAGMRVVCKHLGKSRSASAAAAVVASPVSRSDDSLMLQHDGIQSAILHCKRSFSSSRDSSFLTRSTSSSLQEKMIYSSARDSFVSSGSDFSSEKSTGSARNSNEERNGFTI